MQVSYALLVFFSGMFIATAGFNATGAPEEFWLAVEPHSRIETASGVTVLSLVVTVLSNLVSNVPTGTLIALLSVKSICRECIILRGWFDRGEDAWATTLPQYLFILISSMIFRSVCW